MRREGVLYALTESLPNPDYATSKELQNWQKADRKARPHIVLNLEEEPTTVVTSLLKSDASSKDVWNRLCSIFQRENIRQQLNL